MKKHQSQEEVVCSYCPPDSIKPFICSTQKTTFVCIASGPSLCQEQIDELYQYKDSLTIIGVNNNWEWKPTTNNNNEFICDHVYAADPSFWSAYIKDIKESGFTGNLWIPIQKGFAQKHQLNHVPCRYAKGLGTQGFIHCHHNSGAQAIGLSFFMGAKKIILIGYDMKTGAKGKVHWFGDHSRGLRNTPNKYSTWISNHEQLNKDLVTHGIDVVNCSIETAIPFYRKSLLKKELSILD